jgi:phenylpyruvate tautomerase PptA (4-oxalocrotonate tautomerase family)
MMPFSKESLMPQVNITVIGDSPSPQQKTALFERITDLMVNILGVTRKLVVASVTAAPASDWSAGGIARTGSGVAGVQAVLKVLAGSASDDQKAQMIAQMTGVLRDVLGQPSMPLYAIFEEIPTSSWGYDGQPVSALAHAPS